MFHHLSVTGRGAQLRAGIEAMKTGTQTVVACAQGEMLEQDAGTQLYPSFR